MAKTKTVYRCTECGADHSKWQGRCDTCGEWNTLVEEIVAPQGRAPAAAPRGASAARGRSPKAAASRSTPRLRDVTGSERRALEDRARRVRLRARRRHRSGLDDPHRRRAGHRQVDAAAAGRGAARGGGHRHALRVGRRIARSRSSCAPTGSTESAGDVSLLSETNLETILATSAAVAPAVLDRRLDPDGVHRRSRGRAGQRRAGARVRRAADALREGERHHGVRRRTRDEGRRHRRPEDARAHRRHGALLRGREHARPSRAARDEEPLRQRRRDRRVPHVRAAGSSRSRIRPSCSWAIARATRRAAR